MAAAGIIGIVRVVAAPDAAEWVSAGAAEEVTSAERCGAVVGNGAAAVQTAEVVGSINVATGLWVRRRRSSSVGAGGSDGRGPAVR